MIPIKHNAGTMLYMCRGAKHRLSCSVTAIVTDLNPSNILFRGCAQFKYYLHEFVTARTTIRPSNSALSQDTHWIPQVQHFRILLEYISNLLGNTARVDDNLVTELQGKDV
jgi:hypothetical protein